MAEFLHKHVAVDGSGDYTSLEACLNANEQDLTGDGWFTVEITEGANADTSAVTIHNYTTTAADYINIIVVAGARHDGKYNTSKYRLEVTGTCLTVQEDYVRFDGMQVKCTTNADSQYGFFFSSQGANNDVRIGHSIIKGVVSGTNGGTVGILVYESSARYTQLTVFNTIVYDFYNPNYLSTRTVYGIRCIYGDIFAYNCTVSRCATGVQDGGATDPIKAINVVSDCDDSVASSDFIDFVGTLTGSDYCASHDATAPGANSQINKTFTWVGAEDFHTSDADLIAYGTNDPGAGLYSDDIDFVARPATWSIGADDVAAGGLSIPYNPWLQLGPILAQ